MFEEDNDWLVEKGKLRRRTPRDDPVNQEAGTRRRIETDKKGRSEESEGPSQKGQNELTA